MPERSEHALGEVRVLVQESRAVTALVALFIVAAFLLGMIVFYPVSPLGR